MSSTRTRSKHCVPLDSPANNASSSTAYLNRWSQVVPSGTTLTFVALWDPEEGMVTFSGSELEPESSSGTPSHLSDGEGDYLQLISVDRDTDETTITGENTATLATLQDAFSAFLELTPSNLGEQSYTKAEQDAPCCLQTRASSTFDGLDVYSHDIQTKPKRSLQLSYMDLLDTEPFFRTPCELGRLQLRSDLTPDACRSNSESDSGPGGKSTNLNSRFSTTTTSTSNYVDVTNSALQSVHISETTIVPDWTQPNGCVSPSGSWPQLPHRRGVLRKRRPWDGDATPTGTRSMPSTPRKVTPKSWTPLSPVSPSPSSTYPSTMTLSSNASAVGEERRGQFTRSIIPGPIVPTPPNIPSKGSRLKLRLAFLPRWKSRQTSLESEGWVYIEVTSIIKQHYVADLD